MILVGIFDACQFFATRKLPSCRRWRARGCVLSSMTRQQPHLSHPKYRPDIDGLRAIAVLAVVAFHAFPSCVKGGFVGVDVFFVISGYLISTIVFDNLDKGTFSFAEFYARRVKRIFPALILVLASCFAFGWFVLLADEYKQLGKHIAAGAGFVSNIVLWNEAGYFDSSAEAKPLLHLWSLGIEEQFYIAWPLLLWLAWKCRFNLLMMAIVGVVASFVLNMKDVEQSAVAAFYSPQTRFWELLCGSLLAWAVLYKKGAFAGVGNTANGVLVSESCGGRRKIEGATLLSAISCLGLLLLTYGFWRINKGLSFPGKWALVPVLGAVLIIMAGSQAWVNRHILSNRVAVWFGLISFPLYLWHWPLLSFARIIQSKVPDLHVRVVAVALSILLAWLTCKVVERPMRWGHHGKVKVTVLVLLMALIGAVGYKSYEGNGYLFRDVIKLNVSLQSGEDGGAGSVMEKNCGINNDDIKRRFASCVSDVRGSLRYALIGDSKASALFDGLVRTSTKEGRWMFIGGYAPTGAPVPVISDAAIYKQYQQASTVAIDAVAKNKAIEKVVLVTATRALFQLHNDSDIEDLPSSQNYVAALEGLKASVKILKESGKQVVFVVDNPTLPHPEDCLNRSTAIPLVNQILVRSNPQCVLSLERHLFLSRKYRELLSEVQAAYPNNVEIFDTTKYLCDESKGVCTHRREGRALYVFTDHISDYAAGLIGRDLNVFLAGK